MNSAIIWEPIMCQAILTGISSAYYKYSDDQTSDKILASLELIL